MSTENENKELSNMEKEEIIEEIINEEETSSEEIEEVEETDEEVSDEVEEIAEMSREEVEKEIIEEFAPKPIDIPNYDKEKEQIKRAKVKQKQKTKVAKKSKKRRKLVKKIVSIVTTTLLFILLVIIGSSAIASLTVKVNTTELALKNAIMDNRPETFILGNLDEELRDELILNESSARAGIADIIKDNSNRTVNTTYADIEREVRNSTYPSFVASIASDVIDYYLYGGQYVPVTKKEVSEAIYKNASKVDFLTGRKLFETQCDFIAESVVESKTMKELSKESLDKQKSSKITGVTSAVLSLPVLIGMVLAFILLIVLVIIVCNGYAHKIIGFSIMVSGVLSGAAGFIYKPMFKTSSAFIEGVMNAIVKEFNAKSLLYGAIIFVVGLVIVLIGSAMADRDIEEYEDEDYIEELETA